MHPRVVHKRQSLSDVLRPYGVESASVLRTPYQVPSGSGACTKPLYREWGMYRVARRANATRRGVFDGELGKVINTPANTDYGVRSNRYGVRRTDRAPAVR